MTVTIRRAVADDAGELAIVAAATFPLACPPHTTEEAKARFVATVLSEERFAEYVADGERMVLIAHDTDGQAVGYTMVNFGEPADDDVRAAIRIRPTAELSKCYVLAGHHGAGIATHLMSASLEEAAARGAAGMWLGVNEENARAQRFYAKHGFERVGAKHFLVGDRMEDDWVMEREL
ncbi:GNAT family N-acetyltransferase [Leifsonia sp. NPDC058292]|uniref:GNAT family N-acetyltransferase n=1 Tax=Leifsonia sp. NPDC058292 TaxID=3346428 RepID=UPI0036D8CA23